MVFYYYLCYSRVIIIVAIGLHFVDITLIFDYKVAFLLLSGTLAYFCSFFAK